MTPLLAGKIEELIERVEKLTGPDRELDWRIAEAFDIPDRWPSSTRWPPFMANSAYESRIPNFTASIDAALALVERMLPGWACGFDRGPKTAIAFVDRHDFVDRIGGGRYVAKAATAPLAILSALLQALNSEDK